jgi:hypothetical protein
MSYVIYDILGLKRNDNTLKNLINHQNKMINILALKFLSSFAKDYYAREYMVC